MRLEGTLDAFSLPDIFQLLSFTKKTGTLHLRRDGVHGVVHLRAGSVTGGRTDVTRQELGRRLLGTGLLDDEVLAAAAEELAADPTLSLAQLLAEKGRLAVDTARTLAAEQATDAVFSLLRWSDGEFAFVVDEPDLDDLGAQVPVEEVVAEGLRRITAWEQLVEALPAPDAVVAVHAAPEGEPAVSREEWALLSLVDGRRTVADLVALAGCGEYTVVSALAGLVGRGLLVVQPVPEDRLVQRQKLLAALEGDPVDAAAQPAARPAPPLPRAETAELPAAAAPAPRQPVLPQRPEPFTPPRRPEHDQPAAARGRAAATASGRPPPAGAAVHGSVHGATALAPETSGPPAIERDPSVNKSLLLRLIAGVRGL